MSRRFRTSKYKNAAPKLTKHEPWIRDLSVGSYSGHGNFIKCSAAYVCFNINTTGSQLGVVELEHEGSTFGSNIPVLNAHSDLVTDFDFSPLEDGLLATCSADSTIKIWSLNGNYPDDLSTLSPDAVTKSKTHRTVSTCSFHPTAEFLLGYTSQNTITLWDILHNKELYHDNDTHNDTIMSLSWSKAGSMFVTSAKDGQLRILDPRSKVVTSTSGHQNKKDSRVLWLGDSNFILSTGFDNARKRQVFIRDVRKFATTLHTTDFDSSTGVLIPLYDPDTNMLFLSGRGDTSIIYEEFSESEPFLNEGYRYIGDQTKGISLVPKRAINVMQTEVNRIVQLTASGVTSISYHVARKSYLDFHEDLFPKTRGTNSTSTAANWIQGLTGTVGKISLNPMNIMKKDQNQSLIVFKDNLLTRRSQEEMKIAQTILELEIDNKEKFTAPEPLPRKISISSNSSDDSGIPVVPIPVPRPRVNNTAMVSHLRTPSSFLSKRAADFGKCFSVDDSQLEIMSYSSPTEPEKVKPFSPNINQNLIEEKSSSLSPTIENGNDKYHNGDFTTNNHHNGNGNHQNHQNNCKGEILEKNFEQNGENKIKSKQTTANNNINNNSNNNTSTKDETDGQTLSTNERRKLFESRSVSMVENFEKPQPRKPRLTVAERLKNFEQNGENKIKIFQQQQTESSNNPVIPGITTTNGITEIIEKNSEKKNTFKPTSTNIVDKKDSSSVVLSANKINKNVIDDEITKTPISSKNKPPFEKPERKFTPPKQEIHVQEPTTVPAKSKKRIDTVFGQVSKYRNFKAVALHKRYHIENLRNISTTCPNESELIQANPERVAVPLNTPGGKIAVFELNKPGKQPDGVIPALVHGVKVMDFMWDPFDNEKLVVGSDDGKIWSWKIEKGGLKEQTNKPEYTIAAHSEKIYFVRFHPLAKDVLASGSYDLTIRIWDLAQRKAKILFQLETEQVQIYSFSWSPCGSKFVTACKDGQIRIYEPRKSLLSISKGKGPAGVRGGRACWVLDGKYLIVSGFDRSSERQLHMYNAKDLYSVACISLDVSPAILVPHYDEDSSLIIMSGRGDTTIFSFDVIEEPPYLVQLSQHRCPGVHQGLGYLKKIACEVQNVEFARALRLTTDAIEPWSFTVPRVKSEFFQDDLFPPTKILWKPSMTSSQWFSGENIQPKRFNLKPSNMNSLCELNSNSTNIHENNKFGSKNTAQPLGLHNLMDRSEEKKQQDILEQAIKNKIVLNTKLEQDMMEGVDEDEWIESE